MEIIQHDKYLSERTSIQDSQMIKVKTSMRRRVFMLFKSFVNILKISI